MTTTIAIEGDLAMGVVVITGATGYLGALLAQRFARERGADQVRCLARRPESVDRLVAAGYQVVLGDLVDPTVCDQLPVGADIVIHAAARLGSTGPRAESFEINASATQRLAQATAVEEARIIYVSTIEAYGAFRGRVLTEDQPHIPNGHNYGESKYAGEQAVSRVFGRAGSTGYTIVRPGMIYGPHSPYWTWRYLQSARQGSIGVLGDGGHVFPVYEDDAVEAIVTASSSTQALAQTYNVVHDENLTWWDWAHAHHMLVQSGRPHRQSAAALRLRSAFQVAIGKRGHHRRLEVELREATIPHTKAHDDLQWQPRRFRVGLVSCARADAHLLP